MSAEHDAVHAIVKAADDWGLEYLSPPFRFAVLEVLRGGASASDLPRLIQEAYNQGIERLPSPLQAAVCEAPVVR